MKQLFHKNAELEYFDRTDQKTRKEIISGIDEFESHISAMNQLDKLIIAKMESLRKLGHEPMVNERFAKHWKG